MLKFIYFIMISGTQFNELYKGESLVKLTNGQRIHNGFEFKEGLNVDTIDFNPIDQCSPGGFYFCKYEDFGKWIYYREVKMDYMWDVKIPDDAKVVILDNKIKCNKFILSDSRIIWNNEQLCLDVVKQNGYALRWIKKRTRDICIEAMKQDGYALQFIEHQTNDICLAAVKQNGHALEWVKKQTEEICLEAVKQNREALAYVREQTEEMRSLVVKHDEYVCDTTM